MSTIPQRLREIARSIDEMECGSPVDLSCSLRFIAAELEAPSADAVPVERAEGMPNAGHPLLQQLVNSIEVVGGMACVDFTLVYEMRDHLASLQERINALEARQWQPLTDEDRTRAFQSLPDMLDGFMKSWGRLHFAKAVEAICREKNSQPDTSKEQP